MTISNKEFTTLQSIFLLLIGSKILNRSENLIEAIWDQKGITIITNKAMMLTIIVIIFILIWRSGETINKKKVNEN